MTDIEFARKVKTYIESARDTLYDRTISSYDDEKRDIAQSIEVVPETPLSIEAKRLFWAVTDTAYPRRKQILSIPYIWVDVRDASLVASEVDYEESVA